MVSDGERLSQKIKKGTPEKPTSMASLVIQEYVTLDMQQDKNALTISKDFLAEHGRLPTNYGFLMVLSWSDTKPVGGNPIHETMKRWIGSLTLLAYDIPLGQQ